MKILLALDGSTFSDAVTEALIARTKSEGTEVRLIYALQPFPDALAEALGDKLHPDFDAARLKERERARKWLAKAARSLERASFEVDFRIVEGEPRIVILRVAEKWDADLIVLGSHGRKGLDRFLIGSVSEAVARHARCSVEIVRPRPAVQQEREPRSRKPA